MIHDEQPALFTPTEAAAGDPTPTPAATARPAPRVNRPERTQGEMRCESLDQRLDPDHPARLVWKLVEGLDLSALYDRIRAVEGQAGRNPSDPRVLFALWLYACTQSVSSARALETLCFEHRAYEWLRGGVPVNYHMLADFRVDHYDLLDQLFTSSLAGLLQEGLIHLDCAAQDGMRVRASAGTSSFKREPKLEESLQQARDHVEKLRAEFEADANITARQKSARERGARERVERVEKALEHVKEIAQQRESRKKGDGAAARASTTDPEARNMKMPDSGFRPAYNVQFATDTESGIILGLDVINQGTDAGQMKPMVDQIEERLGQPPEKMTSDGGFSTLEDIEKTTQAGTTVFTPVKETKKQIEAGKDPYAPKAGDSPIIADWRQRMGTEMAKAIYKLRAQTAELTNARMRNQGMYQVNVRGLAKVKTFVLWYALAQNLLRGASLRVAALRAELEATPK
jgi:transposase